MNPIPHRSDPAVLARSNKIPLGHEADLDGARVSIRSSKFVGSTYVYDVMDLETKEIITEVLHGRLSNVSDRPTITIGYHIAA